MSPPPPRAGGGKSLWKVRLCEAGCQAHPPAACGGARPPGRPLRPLRAHPSGGPGPPPSSLLSLAGSWHAAAVWQLPYEPLKSAICESASLKDIMHTCKNAPSKDLLPRIIGTTNYEFIISFIFIELLYYDVSYSAQLAAEALGEGDVAVDEVCAGARACVRAYARLRSCSVRLGIGR